MKIFIDSADLDEIRQVYQWGVGDWPYRHSGVDEE